MRLAVFVRSVFVALAVVAVAGCAVAPATEDEVASSAALSGGSAPNVRWFGYFASDYDGRDASASALYRSHTNVTFIRARNQWDFVAKLMSARDRGLRAVVALDAYVFQDGALPSYWRDNLDAAMEAIYNHQDGGARLIDSVVAWYIIDEPYWNAFNHSPRIAAATQYANMQLVIDALRTRYNADIASKSIFTIFSYAELSPEAHFDPWYLPPGWGNRVRIPAGVDWVGFDCYDSVSACGDASIRLPITSWFARLKALSPLIGPSGIRTVVIPQSAAHEATTTVPDSDQASIAQWASSYWSLAHDPSVVGVFPFVFETISESGKYWVGVNAMSRPVTIAGRRRTTALDEYVTMGKTVLAH